MAQQAFRDLAQCQRRFDQWQRLYHLHRPPVTRYRPSVRTFPEQLPPIEYGPIDLVRKVQDGGRPVSLGKAVTGDPVALRRTETDGVLAVYFCQTSIHQLPRDT